MYYMAKCELKSASLELRYVYDHKSTAKKEDTPELALKDFKVIIDQGQEAGEWSVGQGA